VLFAAVLVGYFLLQAPHIDFAALIAPPLAVYFTALASGALLRYFKLRQGDYA
jgi:hypothetical protein